MPDPDSTATRPAANSPEDPHAQRRARQAWLNQLPQGARRQQRLAAASVSTSGVLLIAQLATIAWLLEQVFVQQQPLRSLLWPLLGLLVLMLARTGLSTLTQWACGQVADAARLAFRQRIYSGVQARGPLWLRGQRQGELTELLVTTPMRWRATTPAFSPCGLKSWWCPSSWPWSSAGWTGWWP